MADEEGGRVFFSNVGRSLEEEDEIRLTSVGIDIGSSTSHLVFSRLVLERLDNRYVVSEREVFHESEVLLTPYADDMTIDAGRLGAFIARQYELAGLDHDAIDTGALILTGVAVRRRNARDIGGGTSKISVCEGGEVVDQTAVDIGARIISFDEDGNVVRLEEAGRRFAAEAGVPVEIGDCPTEGMLLKIVEPMVERLFEAMGGASLSPETAALLRLDPLKEPRVPDALTFSGGVSEYIYGHEQSDYGDLGPLLAEMIKARVKGWGPRIEPPVEGIRATVVGASQYTIQVSGSTIFVTPLDVLPLRNIPVIVPDLPLDDDALDTRALAGAVQTALRRLDLHEGRQAVALCYRWRGSATFARLDGFCRGVAEGLASVLSRGLPL